MTNQASVDAFAGWLDRSYRRVDVLVNNAGIALDKWQPGLTLDLDLARETMERR